MTAAIIDNTALVYLAQISLATGDPNLDTLLNPNMQLVITTTVYGEATRDPDMYAKDALVKAWLDSEIASGNITVIPTPNYPPGPDAGDNSILSILPSVTSTYGGAVVITDDAGLQANISALSGVNATSQSTYQYLLANWLSGGISYVQYLATADNLADKGLVSSDSIITPGSDMVGTNGTTIGVSSDGSVITVTSSSGAVYELSPTSTFSVNSSGNVTVKVNPPLCFAAGTPIEMADGSARRIEAIALGDLVLAFDPRDPRGPLRSARVTRIFRNVTSEWLVLSNGLTVTPGHRFLNERGEFERIDALLARGGKIVRADGVAQDVAAQRVVYSEATRGLYEEAEELVAAASGALALAPQIARGWRTYNFEVEGLHTYVAGGPGSVPILSFEDGTTLNVADVEQQILAQETFATSGDVIGFVDGANAGRAFNLIEQGAQDERLGDALCAENDNCIDEMMAA